MNDTSKFNEMFDLEADNFIEQTVESVMYKVSPKNGKNGVYSSLIRFIPWYKDPKNSIISKWESWLENPLTKKGMSVDCPSSIGQPSELMDLYWRLKKSNDTETQDKAKYFSRRRKFYAIVQILKDEVRPELEGKLKIFKFGVKIHDKIQAELKPEFGEPHIPFHPFDGRPFHIKCKEIGGYSNYDECKFLDQATPILINGKLASPGNNDELLKYLKENSPNLDDFKFRKWTPEVIKHFNEMKEIILPSKGYNAETLLKPNTNETVKTTETTETTDPKDSNDTGNNNSIPNFDFNID